MNIRRDDLTDVVRHQFKESAGGMVGALLAVVLVAAFRLLRGSRA